MIAIGNRKNTFKKRHILLLFFLVFIVLGFLLPEQLYIPVQGATNNDWNENTFWYEPWGKSGVHKGIDIFAKQGEPVIASTYGIVIYQGNINMGGNVVLVLGPKWRLHYYAHMRNVSVTTKTWLTAGEIVGVVGDTGNAKGKSPHLHYSIVSLFPYPWKWDSTTQGWKKMFFLDPGKLL